MSTVIRLDEALQYGKVVLCCTKTCLQNNEEEMSMGKRGRVGKGKGRDVRSVVVGKGGGERKRKGGKVNRGGYTCVLHTSFLRYKIC